MKTEIKIVTPLYKIIYSITFIILLPFVRGIGEEKDIGLVIVQLFPIIPIVFCCDIYQMEYTDKRWEIINLISPKYKFKMVIKRFCIQIIYLILISIMGYWIFYWQKPYIENIENTFLLYGEFLIAITVSIIFFGMITMILSNIIGNIFAGISISTFIWLYIISKKGQDLLGKWNILSFCSRKDQDIHNYDWMAGVVLGLILIILMLLILPKTLKFKIKR